MFIIDRIDNICLFELEDDQAAIVKNVISDKSKTDSLLVLLENSVSDTRRALEEIIDLIEFFFRYGNDEIESLVLTS